MTDRLTIEMAVAENKLTWDDIKDWPVDAGCKTELADGRAVVSPSVEMAHSRANSALAFFLLTYVRERDLGVLNVAPMDCILAPDTVFQPDLSFVAKVRAAIVTDRIRGAPDLAIEILSPSNREHDTVTKFADYARFGVEEYWIVDPEAKTIRTYENRDGKYALLGEARGGDAVVSRVLPELTLRGADVFPESP